MMLEELKNFISKIENFKLLKASEQVDFFGYYLIHFNKQSSFTPSQINNIFSSLRILPHSNISKYLRDNSNLGSVKKAKIKFIKTKEGFHFLSSFEDELKSKIIEKEQEFINFSIDRSNLGWTPSDIPFINSKIKKNADFFTKLYFLLYYLENSLRKFLFARLSSVLGTNWEKLIIDNVDLAKACSIRRETNLSEMIHERGDNILYYCMWEDYGKILKTYPQVFSNVRDCDEVVAHLNSLTKIRNAIAHNTATIPKEYQDELTLFLVKYIKIMKNINLQ